MLNMENDPSVQKKPYTPPGQEIPVALKPEEIQLYKDCCFNTYFTAGLPFALFCDFLSSRKKSIKGEIVQRSLSKRGFMFFGNVILGSLLFTPFCYFKLLAMRAESRRREQEMQLGEASPITEQHQPTNPKPLEEFSYATSDLITNVNEPESNFSTDFDYSRLFDEDKKDVKVPTTTYDELRAQHRKRYTGAPAPKNVQSEPTPGILTSPTDKLMSSDQPSGTAKKVKRNKYGDEIE